MVSASLAQDQMHLLVSRAIEPHLIVQDDVRVVYEWALNYSRRYKQAPSRAMVSDRFPDWRGETVLDPLEALVEQFVRLTKKRFFESTVLELSEMPRTDPAYREKWDQLDEVLMAKAREFQALVPSGHVGYFSAEFERRVDLYEDEHGRYRPGTPLGIPVIDATMMGVRPGWLVTIAGFSGLGKSNLATHSLLAAFESDKVGLMLSLEMSTDEILQRLDTMVMHWRHSDLMHRRLSDEQLRRWRDVASAYSRAQGEIIVRDKLGGCSIERVHGEIERYRPDVVVIDYVQRMRTMYASKRPRHEQLEEITNELKTIAMDTDTAIIMVSQDNRQSAEQGSTTTNMGGSISVFQAADAYIGMMQDEAMKAQNKMRARLLKFRFGPSPIEVDMRWDPAIGDYGELWRESDEYVRPISPPVP